MTKAKAPMQGLKKPEKKNTGKKILGRIKDFESIAAEYELADDITIRGILAKQAERLEMYLKLIQQLLQPDDFNSLYECSAFDDPEKSGLLDIYKRVIIAHREILRSEILGEVDNSVATIQFAYEEIVSLKPEMAKIVEKMQGSWKNTREEGSMRYFG